MVFCGRSTFLSASSVFCGLSFDYQFKIYWKISWFQNRLKNSSPARSLTRIGLWVNHTNSLHDKWCTHVHFNRPTVSIRCQPPNLKLLSQLHLPKLTEETNSGDTTKFDDVFRRFRMIVRSLFLLVIAYFCLRLSVKVSFVKNGGQPVIASILCSSVLAIFALSPFSHCLTRFYARQDTVVTCLSSVYYRCWFYWWFSLSFLHHRPRPRRPGLSPSVPYSWDLYSPFILAENPARISQIRTSGPLLQDACRQYTSVSIFLTKLLPPALTISVFVTITLAIPHLAPWRSAFPLLSFLLVSGQFTFWKLNKILPKSQTKRQVV